MKLGVTLDILNQKDTPAFYADTLANRPAAGFTGRVFISTDTLDLYRDTGTTWVLLSPSSTGTITGSGAAGQVTYFSAASSITGSNDLFFDSVNGHLGIGTITPSTALTIFHDQNQIIQINQTTATNDTKIAFQNSGTPLWRIGNSYNAGANDWGIFDVVGSIQPLTIKKTTGQTFIGSQTTSSGLLVVNSSTADNQIVAIGANSPSIRVRNAGTAPTQQFGLGLSTATNNFIQGSASGDFCIFNGSTTASPILFGVYDAVAVSVQEAARVSAARNFLVGTAVDSGQKLIVSGTGYVTGNLGVGTSDTSTYRVNVNNTMNVNGNTFLASGSGGVVIGDTTAPIGTLDLKANSPVQYFQSKISVTSGSRGEIGWLNSLGNGTATIKAIAASSDVQATSLQFLTRDTTGSQVERLTISNDGYVLINTTSNGALGLGINNQQNISFVEGSGESYVNIFRQRNSAAGVLAQGLKRSLTGEWASSLSSASARSAVVVGYNNGSIAFYSDSSTTVPNGTDIVTTPKMLLQNNGNLLLNTSVDSGQKLQVNGNTQTNKIISSGSTPSVVVADPANVTITISGNDMCGTITIVNIANIPANTGGYMQLVFSSAFPSQPKLFVQAANAFSTNTSFRQYIAGGSGSFIAIDTSVVMTPNTWIFHYFIIS